MKNKIVKHTLFIGLNDQVTKYQVIDTIAAVQLIQKAIAAAGYSGATLSDASGFYTHADGVPVIEKTIRAEILFADMDSTRALIDTLKTVLNQESIALQVENVTSYLI